MGLGLARRFEGGFFVVGWVGLVRGMVMYICVIDIWGWWKEIILIWLELSVHLVVLYSGAVL